MSATYRQASKASAEATERDPANRLLSHAARFRLPAEMVRDQALLASGLLVEKPGGPSVKPYQPDGLWKELSGGDDYRQDKGEGLYRRSVYTFWKRASPPAGLETFDYIIVGAGSSGCPVARRLSDDPANRVLLIEAGPQAERFWVNTPAGMAKLYFNDLLNWNYHTEPMDKL